MVSDDRTALMSARALATGHQIMWYTINEVLGQGGFGITYLAHDRNLDRLVAIKEYLPTPFAYRNQDLTVKPLTGDHYDNFAWGLNSFLKEAQTLAKFGHDNIVRVHTVFEENSTAYMVMEYEHGNNLAAIYKNPVSTLDQGFFERTYFPIFDGLEQIHAFGFIHRDIKPANIYIRDNDTPVLIDFGSARQTSQQQTGEMTALVTKGYTPLEQYSPNYGDQGPWTDIYALAASMYEGVTGQRPDESLSRSACMLKRKPDLVQRLSARDYPGFDQVFLDAIISGLALEPERRPQSLSGWLNEFRDGSHRISALDQPFDLAEDNTVIRDAPAAIDDGMRRPRATASFPDQPNNDRERSSGVFDATPDVFLTSDISDDFFDNDFERPATGNTKLARTRSTSSERKKTTSKKRTGLILGSCLIVTAAVGAGFYFLVPESNAPVLSASVLSKLPRPASAVSTQLPKEQVLLELDDLLRLSTVYQRGLSVDAGNADMLAGVDTIYDNLITIAGQWNASRHSDVREKIATLAQVLPDRGQSTTLLQASLQSTDPGSSFERVQSMLLAGNIASPQGASVLDEINQLSAADYALLTDLPEWESMMATLNESTIAKLEQREFTAAARIVEAALSLDPVNAGMVQVRSHLSLR